MPLNAHRVFIAPGDTPHYLRELTIDPGTDQSLREVRDILRAELRDGLRGWSQFASANELFEKHVASAPPPVLAPKFRMQGSFAYHTVNEPEYKPPQEIDLDDGVFLPVSFLRQQGAVQPAVLSQGYFSVVERTLLPVCKRHGWELCTNKPSCVRVKLPFNAHVDLALYAIADDQFARIVEKEASSNGLNEERRRALEEQLELMESIYRSLDSNEIMLAHREEGWKPSDPRKLDDWFAEAISRHGYQLRRVCRYLKGWRDCQWTESKLASIALMSAVVKVYDQAGGAIDSARDDKALLHLAAALPGILEGRIDNPVVPGQRLDEGWTFEERKTFVTAAQQLADHLRAVLERCSDPNEALGYLRAAFGQRIPNDPALIQIEDSLSAPAVLTSGLLKDVGDDPTVRAAVQRQGTTRYA
jgi:hypothetical protein